MNVLNQTIVNGTMPGQELSALFQDLDLIILIIRDYFSRIVSGLGIFLNLIFLVILLSKKLKNSIYSYLWSRSFCNLIVCIFGLVYMDPPDQRLDRPLYLQIHQVIISGFTIRTVLLASAITDCLLILNRYFNLSNRQNFWTKIPIKYNLLMCYSLGTIFILPAYFSIRIVQTTHFSSIFYWITSDFGLSLFLKLYILLIFLVESVIPVFFLLIMNIISIRKFRKVMATLTTDQNKSVKAEKRFTKWILVLTAICLITRSLDLLSTVLGFFRGIRVPYLFPPKALIKVYSSSLLKFTPSHQKYSFLIIKNKSRKCSFY